MRMRVRVKGSAGFQPAVCGILPQTSLVRCHAPEDLLLSTSRQDSPRGMRGKAGWKPALPTNLSCE